MKTERQRVILDLVRFRDIYTQEELTQALTEAGFSAAQSTVSRDIRELNLSKRSTDQKYIAPDLPDSSSMTRIFKEGFISVDYACNMLVVRTMNGMGMAVALALDEMKFPEILGTVAGDDTVICVVKSEAQAAALVERLND